MNPSSAPARNDGWRAIGNQFGSVVVLSTADFDAPIWTNKQHVAVRLAEVLPVLYVDSLALRRPRITMADARRVLRRLRSLFGAAHDEVDGLGRIGAHSSSIRVVSPLVIPFHRSDRVTSINRWLVRRQVGKKLGVMPRPVLLWSYTPMASRVLDLAQFDTVLYHCVDDLASVPGVDSQLIRTVEPEFALAADVVVATAPSLRERLRLHNSCTHLHRNVVDVEHFERAKSALHIPDDIARISAPRAVYVGALSDHKIDWNLLFTAASALPEWSFVLIGPEGEETAQRGAAEAAQFPNIHLLGPRGYDELPSYLAGADVGMIPYRLSQHTEAIFPMKTLEYFAAGVPVASSRLPALLSASELPIQFADADGFANAILDASRMDLMAQDMKIESWDDLLTFIVGLLPISERA